MQGTKARLLFEELLAFVGVNKSFQISIPYGTPTATPIASDGAIVGVFLGKGLSTTVRDLVFFPPLNFSI